MRKICYFSATGLIILAMLFMACNLNPEGAGDSGHPADTIPEASMITAGSFRGIYTPMSKMTFSGTDYSSIGVFGGEASVVYTSRVFSAQNGKLRLTDTSGSGTSTISMDGGFAVPLEVNGETADSFVLLAAKRISGTTGTAVGTFQSSIESTSTLNATYTQIFQIRLSSSVEVRSSNGNTSFTAWETAPNCSAEDLGKALFTFGGSEYIALYTFISASVPFVLEGGSRDISSLSAYNSSTLVYTFSGSSYSRMSSGASIGIFSSPRRSFATASDTDSLSGDKIRFTDTATSAYLELTGGFMVPNVYHTLLGPNGVAIPGFAYHAAKKTDGLDSIYGLYECRIDTNMDGTRTIILQQFEMNENGVHRCRDTADSAGTVWGEWHSYSGNGHLFTFSGSRYLVIDAYADRAYWGM